MKKLNKSLLVMLMLAMVIPVAMVMTGCFGIGGKLPKGVEVVSVGLSGSTVTVVFKNTTENDVELKAGKLQLKKGNTAFGERGSASDKTIKAGENGTMTRTFAIGDKTGEFTVYYGQTKLGKVTK